MALTILRTSSIDDSLPLIDEVAARCDALVQCVRDEALPSQILAGLARGAVVVLVVSAEQASHVLGLGADEVVRVGELTRATLSAAVNRAMQRGEARERRARDAHLQRDDAWSTFALLAGALGHELNNPLAAAMLNCELVRRQVGNVLDIVEPLADWAALSMPLRELRQLALDRQGAMSVEELKSVLLDLQVSLQRAAAVADYFRSFAREGHEAVHVGALVRELTGFVGEHLSSEVEIGLELEDTRPVRVARPAMVCLLGALLSHAVRVAKEVSARPKIVIRTSEHEETMAIEVEHDGAAPVPSSPDLVGSPSWSSVGLASARRRAEEMGGELLVDSDERSTRYRLLVPVLELEGVLGRAFELAKSPGKSVS